jgi:hypothetical protein
MKGMRHLLSRAHSFLKHSRVVSRMAARHSHPGVRAMGHVASAMGYGRRMHRRRHHRRHHGGAIKLAGMGLGLSGGRRRHHHRRHGLTNLPMAY